MAAGLALAQLMLLGGAVGISPAHAAVTAGTVTVVRTTGPAGFFTPISATACPPVRSTEAALAEYRFTVTFSDGSTSGYGLTSLETGRTWRAVVGMFPEPRLAGRTITVRARCIGRNRTTSVDRVTQNYPTFQLFPKALRTPVLTPNPVAVGGTATLTDGGGCGQYKRPQSLQVNIHVAEPNGDGTSTRHNYPSKTAAINQYGRWSAVRFVVPTAEKAGSTLFMQAICRADDGSGVEMPTRVSQVVAP